MSRLAVGNDDHPEAALKHLEDAKALEAAARYDGAVYLAGYAVECSLKSVILCHRAIDPTTGSLDDAQLRSWHQKLAQKPFGHKLVNLLQETIGAHVARYLPAPLAEPVLSWSETSRYHAPGRITSAKANEFLTSAADTAQLVVRMQIDGVL